MKKAAATPTTRSRSNAANLSAGDIALQFLDTTWRIGVPVVIFALLGIFADRTFNSAPLCTLIGVVIGFVIAAWLVKLQLDRVMKEES